MAASSSPITPVERYLSRLFRSAPPINTIKVKEIACNIVACLEKMEITKDNKRSIAQKINYCFSGYPKLLNKVVSELFKFKASTVRKETKAVLNYLKCHDSYLSEFTEEVWNSKIQEIAERVPGGLSLIYLCAHFSEHEIPLSWLAPYCENIPDERAQVDMLFQLATYRVLRHNLDSRTCYLPKEHSKIIRREEEFHAAVRALVEARETLDLERPETWPHARLWSRHARRILKSPFSEQMTDVERGAIYTMLGLIHSTVAMNFDKALEYLTLARELVERRKDLLTACPVIYSALGRVYHMLEDRENSIRYHLKALKLVDPELFVQVLRCPAINTLACVADIQDSGIPSGEIEASVDSEQVREKLSWALVDLGEFDLALGMYPQKENDQLNAAKNALLAGTIASRQGNKQRAVAICRQGIEAIKGVPSHPVRAVLLAQLASVTASEKEYKRARAELKELYPKLEHFDCARIDSDSGSFCLGVGKYQKALEFFECAVARLEKLLNKRMHPLLAENYIMLGQAYLRTNHKEEARKFITKAQDMCQILFSNEENLTTANLYYCLGELVESDAKYAAALQYYQKAFAIFLPLYGRENQIVRELAGALERVGQRRQEVARPR